VPSSISQPSWSEDASIKLSSVASSLKTVSARAMLTAMTEVVVRLVAFQHPVGRNQDGVRDRDLSPAHPTPFRQPGVLHSEIVLAAGGEMLVMLTFVP
jgi:hypothetical protein